MRSIAATLFWFMSSATYAMDPSSFSASEPGKLEGRANGVADSTIYFKQIRFPLEAYPAYLNSQVYRKGGGMGPDGGQCAAENYSYPWHDNYCEAREWAMPLCPSGKGHQGQDIRPATCVARQHWAVAVEDGVISSIGKYSVTLVSEAGTTYRYLHLAMNNLEVDRLQRVKRGDRIGKVSNDFGGAPTTIHLHFDIKDTVLYKGKRKFVFVPPYASLKDAYERLLNGNP